MADPRVFFAAERTLLAWVRSGITVMALGFVIARFSLFLTLVSNPDTQPHPAHQVQGLSGAMGIAMVVLGATVILGAAYNHRLYVRQLPLQDVPSQALPWLTSLLAVVVALMGLLLALYLGVT